MGLFKSMLVVWFCVYKNWLLKNTLGIDRTHLVALSAFLQLSSDDAVNITNELHDPNARKNHLRNKKRKDLIESTGVVPVEYSPKVKLELFSQL